MADENKGIRNLKIPSLGAILHFISVEAVSQFIWWGFSHMITNVWVKDIGILVVFVASIFAVAWYLPKLSPSFFRRKSETLTTTNDKIDELTEKLRPFWELRNGQLQNLKQSNSRLILSRVESVQFEGLKNPEPYVIIQFLFVDSSIFKLELKDTKLAVKLNQSTLPTDPSLMNDFPIEVWYWEKILLQFRQPITTTADIIHNSIEKREKIIWKFDLKANCVIKETGDVFPFTHLLDYTHIPFRVD